jgi:CubicO group peptidase (beta-lactamase class C family)
MPLSFPRIILLLSSTIVAGRSDLAAQGRCDPAFQPVADTVRRMVAGLGLEGAALMIRIKGRPVCETYVGAFGPETMFPVVSGAKWISAATILTLVDERKLGLDDPVSRWLPYFKGDKKGITLRQLLSHTSGLPPHVACMFQPDLPMDACVRQIAGTKLVAKPGTKFIYGGTSYTVAGHVAEVAAGEPWAKIFSGRLAGPLGLEHTGYGVMPNPMLSEGEAYSSAADYMDFLQMIADSGVSGGRRVLSAAAIAEMMRDQTVGTSGRDSPRGERSYGLGCWRDEIDSTTGRPLVVTSPGAGGFVPWVALDQGMIGVLAVVDKIERVWPTALAVLRLARQGAATLDTTAVRQ